MPIQIGEQSLKVCGGDNAYNDNNRKALVAMSDGGGDKPASGLFGTPVEEKTAAVLILTPERAFVDGLQPTRLIVKGGSSAVSRPSHSFSSFLQCQSSLDG